jgi:hypothetical protein
MQVSPRCRTFTLTPAMQVVVQFEKVFPRWLLRLALRIGGNLDDDWGRCGRLFGIDVSDVHPSKRPRCNRKSCDAELHQSVCPVLFLLPLAIQFRLLFLPLAVRLVPCIFTLAARPVLCFLPLAALGFLPGLPVTIPNPLLQLKPLEFLGADHFLMLFRREPRVPCRERSGTRARAVFVQRFANAFLVARIGLVLEVDNTLGAIRDRVVCRWRTTEEHFFPVSLIGLVQNTSALVAKSEKAAVGALHLGHR